MEVDHCNLEFLFVKGGALYHNFTMGPYYRLLTIYDFTKAPSLYLVDLTTSKRVMIK